MEPKRIENLTIEQSFSIEYISDQRVRLSMPGRMAELHPGEKPLPITVDIHLPKGLEGASSGSVQGLLQEVVVSLHGQGANAEFDEDLALAVRDSGRVVIAPTTSRLSEYNPDGSEDFPTWQTGSFGNKHYRDEVTDFTRGIEAARAWLKQQRLPHAETVQLVLMGQSLGGTMAASLAERFKPRELILVSPACYGLDANPDEALLGQGTPTPEELSADAKAVANTVVIRGEQDVITSTADAEAFGGRLISIPEAGHTFGKLSFMEGDELDKRKELAQAVLAALGTL